MLLKTPALRFYNRSTTPKCKRCELQLVANCAGIAHMRCRHCGYLKSFNLRIFPEQWIWKPCPKHSLDGAERLNNGC